MHRVSFMVALLCAAAVAARGQEPAEKSNPQSGSENREASAGPTEPIEAALRNYVAAFNTNDAAKLAARWAPQGVYANKTTGERTSGREALQRDFQALFEESPGVRLSGQVDGVRMIKPEVAAADGQVTVVFPDGDATQTAFSAVLIKEGEEWLLDSIHEADLPSPESPFAALADLEWMIGHWVDESADARVDTVVRWSPSRAFLLRSFSAQLPGEAPMEGTQVIGWDPIGKQIRSWTFTSDGSFGEATWSRNGGDWLVRSTQTLFDGRLATGTQVITRVDENTLSVQMLNRTIDDEPVGSTDPVTVVRLEEPQADVAEPAAKAAPAGTTAPPPPAPKIPSTTPAPAPPPKAPTAPSAAPAKAPAATATPAAPATKAPAATTKKQGARP